LNASRRSRLLKSLLGREHDEIPWRTNRNMLQNCLACRWGVSIVISVASHQRDHQQSRLFSLLAELLNVGYAPMMTFAASLPIQSMHIIRPQSSQTMS